MTYEIASKRWELNKQDLSKIAKVFAWAQISAALGYVLMTIPQINIPPQYAAVAAMLLPTINTLLVAAKKWTAGKASGF